MRITKRSKVLITLLWVLFVSACATAPPTKPTDICSVFKEKRGWHAVAVKAEKKWGTSMHIPMAFMYQESTFRHKARPPRSYLLGFIPWRRASSAYGYAQAIDGTWEAYRKDSGDHWRKRSKFDDATDFIHWYVNQAVERNGVKKTDVYSLYLNYHEGVGGFAKGSYKNKPQLKKIAAKVKQRALDYQSQYAGCKASLKPTFWKRMLGW